jgi:hypothetical protein
VKGIPVLGPGTLVYKNPPVPIFPACDWGQGPVLESILPLRRCGQSPFKGDPLRFSCDEISRIRVSHETKVVGSRIGLGANQKLGGRFLKESGKKSQVKIGNLNAE